MCTERHTFLIYVTGDIIHCQKQAVAGKRSRVAYRLDKLVKACIPAGGQ
jgi:hypothetical protein